MSSGKRRQKKRKRHSSPIKSQVAVRLERLRSSRRKNLWSDDDDDEDEISRPSNVIILSDSEEEKPPPRKRKSRKNTPKNATCLICSILSQLSTKNCCSEHLSRLKHHSPWLPEQVMILPVTDEIVQRYLDPQQIHHLRTQTSTMTLGSSRSQSSKKYVSTSPAKSPLPPLASTIVIEPARLPAATIIPPDIPMESPTINTTELVAIIDEPPLIIIDDTPLETTSNKPMHDPWSPISDATDTALEEVLEQNESSSDLPLEFTPTTVRRTNTEIMAACLPKIPLKPGRFRQGKPIGDRPTTNAANEYRPLASSTQSPPNIRPTSPNLENHNDDVLTQNQTNEPPTHTTNEGTTPSRVSFRLNPDGTRVSISRPPLPTNAQSPLLNSLRRTSTDVTPLSKQV